MNASPNIAAQIAAAETAGDIFELAAIARQLLIERPAFKATKPKAVARRRAATHENEAYLTNTERRALGLPQYRDGKISGRPYRWVLVTFENGMRALSGYYPRAKTPDDLSPAIIGARSRYLVIMGDGRFVDAAAAKRVPRVTGARVLTDAAEIDRERLACLRMRVTLQAAEEARRRVGQAFSHRHQAHGFDRGRFHEHVRQLAAVCRQSRHELVGRLAGTGDHAI